MWLRRVSLVRALAPAAADRAFGQVGASGAGRGTIIDSTGAFLPDVNVTITNSATNAACNTQSNSAVDYNAPAGVMRQGEGNPVSINGGRPEGNNYTPQCLLSTDQALQTPAAILSQGALGEFKVESAIKPAENGFGASQINPCSEGGTNSLHAALSESYRNNAFDTLPFPAVANGFRSKPTVLNPPEGVTNFFANIPGSLTMNQQTYRGDQLLAQYGSVFGRRTHTNSTQYNSGSINHGIEQYLQTEDSWEISHTVNGTGIYQGKTSGFPFRAYLSAKLSFNRKMVLNLLTSLFPLAYSSQFCMQVGRAPSPTWSIETRFL